MRTARKLLFRSVILGLALFAGYVYFGFPSLKKLAVENPPETAFMVRGKARLHAQGQGGRFRHEWVPLEKISPYLVEAVLIAEDDRFYSHRGFDLIEIENSLRRNLDEGKWARGGSTITQQLAKNLYLSPEKSLRRKLKEAILTLKIEHCLTKDRILEIYLNVVEWGRGSFGAQAAALTYFSKPASQLNAREAADLAARLPNPDLYDSGDYRNRLLGRKRVVLARLEKRGVDPHRNRRRPDIVLAKADSSPEPGRDSFWSRIPFSLPSGSGDERRSDMTGFQDAFRGAGEWVVDSVSGLMPRSYPEPEAGEIVPLDTVPSEREAGSRARTRREAPKSASSVSSIPPTRTGVEGRVDSPKASPAPGESSRASRKEIVSPGVRGSSVPEVHAPAPAAGDRGLPARETPKKTSPRRLVQKLFEMEQTWKEAPAPPGPSPNSD